MGNKREKDRKLNRKRRRITRIRKLKARLIETKDSRKRQELIEKISKISHRPWAPKT